MMADLYDPKILILTFPLQYQRVEGKYTSLEPLIAQEREHIKNLVSRIASLKPNLLLVEKSVSNIALEFLLKMDIPVVQNIKFSLLEKIGNYISHFS
jgi:1-phosphatidylinositol-3-phosphate 5-kinase